MVRRPFFARCDKCSSFPRYTKCLLLVGWWLIESRRHTCSSVSRYANCSSFARYDTCFSFSRCDECLLLLGWRLTGSRCAVDGRALASLSSTDALSLRRRLTRPSFAVG